MNKKVLVLGTILISSAWSGLYKTLGQVEEAEREASSHKRASSCVGVVVDGHPLGSGALVEKDVVVTAAHVLNLDDFSCKAEGVFSVGSPPDCRVWVGGNIGAAVRELTAPETVPVKQVYFNQEADIAFLVLDHHVPPQYTPTPVMSMKDHRAAVVKPLRFGAKPRVSGRFSGGVEIEYIGCGRTVVVTPEMDCLDLDKIWEGGIGSRDGFRLGRLQLSEHYPYYVSRNRTETALYGFVSLDAEDPDPDKGDGARAAASEKVYASVLPGDSGAPVFAMVDEEPHLFGVVSTGKVSRAFGEERVACTKAVSLQGFVPKTKGDVTWWSTFLELRRAQV